MQELRTGELETAEDVARMPDEYQGLLKRQMLVHTEGELSGADTYTQNFYHLAPNAYEKKVCCERAAEEMDHYEIGARVCSGLGIDTKFMLEQRLQDRKLYATEGVTGVFNWPQRALFSFIGEDAVMDHIKEMAQSSYKPWANSFDTIIRDEKVHIAHGLRITREYCETDSGRQEIQDALDLVWPGTLDLFGKADSPRSKLYLKWGLRQKSNEQARQEFATRVRPKLEALGLDVPDDGTNRKFV